MLGQIPPYANPLAASLALIALASGCSGEYAIAPVAGQVTLNGAPLAGAAVTFQPVSKGTAESVAVGSYGHTDADGRFALRLVSNDHPGAMVGTHAVTISLAQSHTSTDAVPALGHKIPASFRDGSERFAVPAGGTSEANFELKSP
jgi:hypothetical protein